MDDDPILFAKEAAPFMCGYGIHRFCDAAGLDYMKLVREGYPMSVLLATGDTLCAEVIEKVLAVREAANNGQ